MTSTIPAGGHQVVIAESAVYPRIEMLPDGRLAAGYARNVAWDYFVGGDWFVALSEDGGRTWMASSDGSEAAIPLTWPASSTRERHDRFAQVLPDGTWWTAGVVGWQAWPASDQARAEAEGRYVTPTSPPGSPGSIGVGTNTFFIQKSSDQGTAWDRREIDLMPAGWTLGLPRNIALPDGTVLLPARQRSADGSRGQFLCIRVTPGDPDVVRVHQVPRDLDGRTGSEAALAYLGGDDVLMLMRADALRGGDGRMLASWSSDGGRSWTSPTVTGLRGRPPHLLTLADGRLLVTYGHQRSPHGVLAAVSTNGGETWDVDRPILVAEDPEAGEPIGYHPMTVQLPDGDLFTSYYALRDGVSHALGVRWSLPT